MTIIVTPAQEAAANAVGELARDLGLVRLAISSYPETGNYYVSGEIGEDVATAIGETVAGALHNMIAALNEKIENPQPKPLREPAQVKAAAMKIIAEARDGDSPLALDEIAGRVAAIPVKE